MIMENTLYCSHCSRSGISHCFWKGADSKYFRFCRPNSLCLQLFKPATVAWRLLWIIHKSIGNAMFQCGFICKKYAGGLDLTHSHSCKLLFYILEDNVEVSPEDLFSWILHSSREARGKYTYLYTHTHTHTYIHTYIHFRWY